MAPAPSFAIRVAPIALLLLAAVLFASHRHRSPSSPSAPSSSVFLRPPSPVSRTALPPPHGCQDRSLTALEPREKAAIVLLLREQDRDDLLPTLTNFEQRFNAAFRYPYVFLSSPDEPPFTDEFRAAVRGVLPEGATTEWATVPVKHWELPKGFDRTVLRDGFKAMAQAGVQYAGREAYHHMCRFYSGFFARQDVLAKYDWYWRLEPGG